MKTTKKKALPVFALKPLCALVGLLLGASAAWAANYPSVPLSLTGGQSSVKPNVLLFIDTSGSMAQNRVPPNNNTRAEEAKKAAKVVIESNRDLRFGLATFNDGRAPSDTNSPLTIYGANIRVPIDDIDEDKGTTHFNLLQNTINSLQFQTGTPTTSAYYELTRYYRGMSGAYPGSGGARKEIQYTSPIQYRCQRNFIVFISDGQPEISPWGRTGTASVEYLATYPRERSSYTNYQKNYAEEDNMLRPLGPAFDEDGAFGSKATGKKLEDSSATNYRYPNGDLSYERQCTYDKNCKMYTELGIPHFAEVAYTQDMMPNGMDAEGQSFNDPKFPKQTIETYTIGFAANIPLLEDAAQKGGGTYHLANSATALQQALNQIFNNISLATAPFASVAPAITVNANNEITSAQTLSLNTENWSSQLRFYDVDANNVVGSAYKSPTYNPAASVAVISTRTGAQNLASTNTALDNTTFGLSSNNKNQWQGLVNWLTRRAADATSGYRVRTPDADRYLGDVLGGNLVAMGVENKSGYTYGDSRQQYLAVGSNDGMVHVYQKHGAANHAYTDVFQYIPGLARNQAGKSINERLQITATPDKNNTVTYGAQNPSTHQNLVSGPISWYETYSDDNRSRVFMTGTLGQGGKAAYALNIAGRDANNSAVGLDAGNSNWLSSVPLWDTSSAQIGAAQSGVDGIIGHTFGEPFNGRIALAGSVAAQAAEYKTDMRYATVLGSGFDPAAGTNGRYPTPSVFVLDSLGLNAGANNDGQFLNPTSGTPAGKLLRQISVPANLADNISTSSPKGLTSPTGLDIDGDGVWDVAYAGDQNGNVYRFDFRAEQSKWNVEIIFKGSSSQPITAQPNVHRNPITKRVTVVFGTGSELYSSDLTDTGLQRFYGIQDPLTDNPEIGGDLSSTDSVYPITPTSSTLLQRTYTQSASGRSLINGNVAFNYAANKGWYINLTNNGVEQGERVVVKADVGGTRRRGGSVVFTTRIFDSANTAVQNSCTASGATNTSGFLMAVDAETGGRPLGMRFLKDSIDYIGKEYKGSLSQAKLFNQNGSEQTLFGGSQSGKAKKLKSSSAEELSSGCINNTIRVGVGSSETGANVEEFYCPGSLAVQRLSWREIF